MRMRPSWLCDAFRVVCGLLLGYHFCSVLADSNLIRSAELWSDSSAAGKPEFGLAAAVAAVPGGLPVVLLAGLAGAVAITFGLAVRPFALLALLAAVGVHDALWPAVTIDDGISAMLALWVLLLPGRRAATGAHAAGGAWVLAGAALFFSGCFVTYAFTETSLSPWWRVAPFAALALCAAPNEACRVLSAIPAVAGLWCMTRYGAGVVTIASTASALAIGATLLIRRQHGATKEVLAWNGALALSVAWVCIFNTCTRATGMVRPALASGSVLSAVGHRPLEWRPRTTERLSLRLEVSDKPSDPSSEILAGTDARLRRLLRALSLEKAANTAWHHRILSAFALRGCQSLKGVASGSMAVILTSDQGDRTLLRAQCADQRVLSTVVL